MKEKRYTISEAAKMLEVENHVLRYWEEELNLAVPRNELGHRYYREEEIQLLNCIKELKKKGFQLKAVKEVLPDLEEGKEEEDKKVVPIHKENRRGELSLVESASETAVRTREEKMQEFEMIMGKIIGKALRENARDMGDAMGDRITGRVLEEVDELFEEKEEREEERYRKLDEAIRSHQKARQEIAATMEDGRKRKSRFFKKNKRKI